MNYEINIQIPNEDPKITFVATGPAGPAGAAGQDSIVGTVTDGAITAAKLHTDLSGIATLNLPDNTTITTFTAGLLDDSDAAAARTTLGLNDTSSRVDIAANTSGTADTVKVTANTGTGETNKIVFIGGTAGATVAGQTANVSLHADTDLTFNPGTGMLNAPASGGVQAGKFAGPTDNDLTIESDKNITFVSDLDADDSSALYSFKYQTTQIASLDQAGSLQINGSLDIHGDISMGGTGVEFTIDSGQQNSSNGSPAILKLSSFSTENNAIDINSSGGVDIDATTQIHLNSTQSGSVSAIRLNSAGGIDIDAGKIISVDTTDTTDGIKIGTATSGVPIAIGHGTSEVTIGQNLTVGGNTTLGDSTADTVTIAGNLIVNGTTTTVNSTVINLNDHNIVLDSGNESGSLVSNGGITINSGGGDDAKLNYTTSSGGQWEFKLGDSFENLKVATLIGDVSATTISVDGTSGQIQQSGVSANNIKLSTASNGTPQQIFSTDTSLFVSASDLDPLIIIKNTNSNANSARLTFLKDKTDSDGNGVAGANSDNIGIINFEGGNSAQEETDFGKILVQINEATDTGEAGKMFLQVASSDGSTSNLRDGLVLTGHTSGNYVDATIGFGASSTVTTGGNLTVTSNLTLGSSTAVSSIDTDLSSDVSGSDDTLASAKAIKAYVDANSGGSVSGAQTAITSIFNSSLKIGHSDSDANINFATDNQIEFDIDGTAQIKLTDGVLAPVTNNDIDLGTSSLQFKDGFFDGTLEVDALSINGTTVTSTAAELNILDGVTSTASELNILDGVTATAAEINLIDGGTSVGADALENGDGIIVNDGGTMKLTAVQTVRTYMQSGLSLTIGADSGSNDTVIVGTNTLNFSGGNGIVTTVSDNDISIAANVDDSSLEINSDQLRVKASGITNSMLSTITTSDKVAISAVDIDGGADIDAALVDADLFIVDDGAGGTNRKATMSRLKTYINANVTATDVGLGSVNNTSDANKPVSSATQTALDAKAPTAGPTFTGNVNLSSATLTLAADQISGDAISGGTIDTTTITALAGALSMGDNNITNVGDIALDTISADDASVGIGISLTDNLATALTIKQGSDAYLTVNTSNDSESVSIGTGISGTAITIGHATSQTTIGDNLIVNGDLVIGGHTINDIDIDTEFVDADDHIMSSGAILEKFSLKAGSSSIVTTGALDSGSITSGFGNINNGTSTITTGSLTVDSVAIDGTIITMTGSTDDTATFTVGTNGTLDIVTTDNDAAAANIQITADGTAELAGTTVTLDSSGGITLDADGGTITFADGGSSLGTITSTGYSGNAAGLSGSSLTTVNSILATDIKIGEDDQTKIDFETADEIHFYAANAEQVYVADGIFGPQTDSDVDLGTNSVRWKDAYVDSVTSTGAITAGGIVTGTGFTAGNAVLAEAELELLDGLTAGTAIASKVVTTDASLNTTGQNNLTITGDLTLSGTDKKLFFRDTALYLYSSADGQLDIVADTEIQIASATVDIDATAGITIDSADNTNITVGGSGKTLDIDASGALTIDSATSIGIGTNADKPIDIDSTTLDIDASGAITIDSTAASNITVTSSEAAEDLTIALAGDTDSSLILSSTGTGADALQIKTTAGGIDITSSGASAGEDIDISTDASVNITSTENAANSILLHANGGTSETIKIHSDQGNSANSIHLVSDAGGVNINCGGDALINAVGSASIAGTSGVNLDSNATGIVVIKGNETGGTDQVGTIQFNCEQNSHYIRIKPQLHSVLNSSGSKTLTLPAVDSTIATIGGDQTFSGKNTIDKRQFAKTTSTDGNAQGDIVYFSGQTGTIAAGNIVHYNSSGNWELADATDNTKSDGLLGVALGDDVDVNGVLLRGMVTLDHDPGGVGDVLFLTTTAGDCSSTAPSGNNNIIRTIGYCLDASDGQIWFNPDSTFITYTTS